MATPSIPVLICDYITTNLPSLAPITVGGINLNADDQVSVWEFPGGPNVRVHGGPVSNITITALHNAMIQIQVRNKKAQTALSNMISVVNLLDGLVGMSQGGYYFTDLTMTARPRVLDRAEDNSVTYAADFKVQVR